MRALWIDDGLPAALAAELRGRGRDAVSLAELGLDRATDRAVLEAADAAGAVLVTTLPLPGAALITPAEEQRRRETVHRHAHDMAVQRSGSTRRYPR